MMESLNGETVAQPEKSSISEATSQKDSVGRGDEPGRGQGAEPQVGRLFQDLAEVESPRASPVSVVQVLPGALVPSFVFLRSPPPSFAPRLGFYSPSFSVLSLRRVKDWKGVPGGQA